MISDDLKLIDDTITFIKSKNDNESYFGIESLYKFELKLFLCLSIVRFELQITKQISDLTADAISQLFTFQCFEYYYRDFRDVYKKCSELSYALRSYNEKLRNHDLKGEIGVNDENWINYFNKTITSLLNSNTS